MLQTKTSFACHDLRPQNLTGAIFLIDQSSF